MLAPGPPALPLDPERSAALGSRPRSGPPASRHDIENDGPLERAGAAFAELLIAEATRPRAGAVARADGPNPAERCSV
jgi:hypothetical protein